MRQRYVEISSCQRISAAGDQPEAIAALAAGIENGLDEQTLLGVTGSGKTFTMAKVIEAVQRPTLVLAHNKTLAAQLCAEFKEFFPNNAVEYFVSYYDYYQPEAYIPHTDTFIEKDSAVNEEIDRLRLAATASLMERRDVIVVSSVSCIYGLGEPEDFAKMMVSLRVGTQMEREELLKKLVSIRYERNDIAFERNMFRVRGDTGGDLPRLLEGLRHPGGVLRRRDRPYQRDQRGHRCGHPAAGDHPHLARHPLCHPQGEDGRRRPGDLQGAGGAGSLLPGQQPAY